MFEEIAKRALGLVTRPPLPPPLAVALAVAEAAVVVCAVAREVCELLDETEGGD